MGFGRACAPVRCAPPSFWVHRHAKRGAMRPPPIAASLLLIRSLKIDKKLSNSGRPRNGLSRNKMLSFRLKFGPPASWDFFFPLDCYTLLFLLFLSLLILLVLFFLFLFFSSSAIVTHTHTHTQTKYPRQILYMINSAEEIYHNQHFGSMPPPTPAS